MPLRIIFMGTPDFSVPVLHALRAAGHEIVAVYSQPPRPAGRRGLELTPSPVHRAAEALGLAVLTPINFKGVEDVFHAASFRWARSILVVARWMRARTVARLMLRARLMCRWLMPRWARR